jgi:hypothetical protein
MQMNARLFDVDTENGNANQPLLRRFDVIGMSGGFWDGQAVINHALKVKSYCFSHSLPDFFNSLASGNTTGKVRR